MFGLLPASPFNVIWLLVPLALWSLTKSIAERNSARIWHNSAFTVSYWEEILFRGIIYGIALLFWDNGMFAIVVSSVLFGFFHLRNLWWSSPRKVVVNCLYNGLVFGPAIGIIRWLTGDIYLGIALHAVHNFISMLTARDKIPKDIFLLSKQKNMNWFEKIFSGLYR